MSERKHALLSASGAERWIKCTPSARLEEQLPVKESSYADEGSLAHEIAELKLRKAFTEPMGKKTFDTRLKKLQEKELYSPEMLGYTDVYLEYVSSIVHGLPSKPIIVVEKKLDFSHIVPEGFGTGDCLILHGSTLHIIDFKYGKGVPVSAEYNPQMMLYAIGAIDGYRMLYDIDRVFITIVQPRLDSISTWETSVVDLVKWAEWVTPIAQKAFRGEGEFVAGEHCRFCRAKAQCRARAEENLKLDQFYPLKPPLISDDEVGEILTLAKNLAKWVSDIEEYALAQCLSGYEIKGWKVVEGRAVRAITDFEKAFEVLKGNGFDEAMLYERKPITLTAIEKLTGKAKFNELLGGYIETPPGKPTLAPQEDKREPLQRVSAGQDFLN
jgi:hypothetical protein